MSIDVNILGSIAATVDSRKVPLGDRRQRLVFGILAHDLHVVENARMMTCLWDEGELPSDPLDQIQGYVSRLRSALGKAVPNGDQLIRTERGVGYALMVSPEQVDRHRFALFKARAEAAERQRPGVAARFAQQALAEWPHAVGLRGGRPLADARLEVFTSSLQQDYRSVLLLRLRTQLACGRHERLLPELTRLSTDEYGAEDPDLTRLHMLALVRAGRSHDAMAVYERHETALDELLFGSKPQKELQTLKNQIMRGDGDLTPADEEYAEYDEAVTEAEPEQAHEAPPARVSFSNHQTGEHARSFQAYEMNFGREPDAE